ncbi:MAG: hypothetical protein AABX33_04080 [Nanoarchaeota archaeon]
MTTPHEELFNNISSLKPIIEIEETKNGTTTSMSRKEYVLVNQNKINLYNLKAHLDTIQKRNYLNRICLSEISKDCENKQVFTNEEIELLKKNENEYHPNFLIQCEYFLFSTKTIFDTILKVIRYLFPETTHKGFGEIGSWVDEDIMKSLISDHLDWFVTFNNRRNRLTHDTIAGISTHFNHNIDEGVTTYSKRNLNIRKDKEQEGDVFQLPDYFDECFSKTDQIINRFYKLLLKQKIEGKN